MSIDILIPTCKTELDISNMIGDIFLLNHEANVHYHSCPKSSAAVNRNKCLDKAKSEYLIMIDDDISGFFPGWEEIMVRPLVEDKHVMMVTARLMSTVNVPQKFYGYQKDMMTPYIKTTYCPSAAIAFRNDGLRFNEKFVGSGFEDTLFIDDMRKRYPGGKIIINNLVRLIHTNEMKNQLGENYYINKKIYEELSGRKV